LIEEAAPTAVADPDAVPAPSSEGDAPAPVVVSEELLPGKRGPGRPLGAKNRCRVATIERITREADPLGYRIRALKRGWILAAPNENSKKRERIPLTKEELLRLAGQLEDKVLPRLRSFEVTGMETTNNNLLIGALADMGENQLANLITALRSSMHGSYPCAIEHTDDTDVVRIQPLREPR
jgi:hypothetical protein